MPEATASALLLRAGLALLAWPVYLLSFLGIWEPFCKKVFFPFFLEKISGAHEKKSKKHKQELFRNLPDFRGPSGELRLLEIGTGSGSNFQFYPAGCKVTCSDINPNFQEGLSRNMKKNQHLHYEQFLVAAGEDLGQVPSGSVDAVVCTLVLCSVQSVSSTLREVLRVLRPVSTCKKPLMTLTAAPQTFLWWEKGAERPWEFSWEGGHRVPGKLWVLLHPWQCPRPGWAGLGALGQCKESLSLARVALDEL
uniref:Methyltransferase type 11 domain-containing protein n=1 Tax=Zonotrichia albicollis TaxID=44394 RepID=A0A8D2NFQ7_ZONAL